MLASGGWNQSGTCDGDDLKLMQLGGPFCPQREPEVMEGNCDALSPCAEGCSLLWGSGR
jgi:hypothetical protein